MPTFAPTDPRGIRAKLAPSVFDSWGKSKAKTLGRILGMDEFNIEDLAGPLGVGVAVVKRLKPSQLLEKLVERNSAGGVSNVTGGPVAEAYRYMSGMGSLKHSEAEAEDRYRKTGLHLGKFRTLKENEAYAGSLSEQQGRR